VITDSLAENWGDDRDTPQRKRNFTLIASPAASLVQQQVLRRETAISGAVSEVLATVVLLAFYAAEELFPHDCPAWQLAEARYDDIGFNATTGKWSCLYYSPALSLAAFLDCGCFQALSMRT